MDCQETHGKNPCYERHFGNQNVETRVIKNADVWLAIKTQASENTHMSVPPEDEALYYGMLWKTAKGRDNKYTITQLARDMGRSPDAIRAALRYCELPKEIQNYVGQGYLSYGIAVELARAKEELSLDEIDFEWWTTKALVKRWHVPEFREIVSAEIRNRKQKQDVLGLFTQAQEDDFEKTYFKRIVEHEMITALWGYIRYFKRVNSLFEEKLLGKKDSPFSVRSPLRVFRALIEQERRLIPHLEGLLSEDELNQAIETLEVADTLSFSLYEQEEPESPIFLN
nr:hypothetical protein [Candidatus Levybacteria bacterium]